ncbi:MAG: hypothetical protein J6333_01690 [Planctomycetes bacterium]|nr:hypothetical protein [Planctomycetota bacterium]
MKKILALVLCGCLCGFLNAAETANEMRREVQDSLARIYSSMFTERIKGLRMFTAILDPQLLGEFKVIDRIREVAENPAENPNVRVEAINTLVVFKTNGIEVPKILELFDRMIKGDANNMRVRNAALSLLPNIAPLQSTGTPANVERDRIVNTLRELYAKKSKLPPSTYLALVSALGNFGDKDGALNILYNIINTETNATIRCAALRAIRNAIIALGKGDKKSLDVFEKLLVKATGDENMEARVLIMDCLESLVAQIPTTGKGAAWKPTAATKTTALKMLDAGKDPEVVAAVKFLMRVSAQDPSIVDNFLKAATPGTSNRQLSFKSLEMVNSGLVNVLDTIGNDRRNKDAADKIIKHMLTMLNPNTAGVPEEIKETMIMGLGIIPPTFSRELAVLCLVDLLRIEAEKEAPIPGRIRQIEDALASLTEIVPFEKISYEQVNAEDGTVRIVTKRAPDIEAWNAWVKENGKSLQPR